MGTPGRDAGVSGGTSGLGSSGSGSAPSGTTNSADDGCGCSMDAATSNCPTGQDHNRTGTVNLYNYIDAMFCSGFANGHCAANLFINCTTPQVQALTAMQRTLFVHTEGRAIDFRLDVAYSPATVDGDPNASPKLDPTTAQNIFNYLISIACVSGIQEVVYNGQIWTQATGTIMSNLIPEDSFTHVHVGLNNCGADNFNRVATSSGR